MRTLLLTLYVGFLAGATLFTALQIRSRWAIDTIGYRAADPASMFSRRYSVGVVNDELVIGSLLEHTIDLGWFYEREPVLANAPPMGGFGGFGAKRLATGWSLFVPIYAPLFCCLAGATVIAELRRRQRSERQYKADGLCVQCGYDLRESPKQCPDCGRPVDHLTAATNASAKR